MSASTNCRVGQPPHVVIVVGGFGGLYAARTLAAYSLRITLIDRENYHLFQPLLYQVATAALSPADIAEPIRFILRRHANVRVVLGEVTRVALDERSVVLADGSRIGYDAVIVATGSRHAYFGHDEWEPLAPNGSSACTREHQRGRMNVMTSRELGAMGSVAQRPWCRSPGARETQPAPIGSHICILEISLAFSRQDVSGGCCAASQCPCLGS